MRPDERAFNIACGLSALSWACLPWWHHPLPENLHPVRVTITVLHLLMAGLFLWRTPLRTPPTPRALLESLPSALIALPAFRLAGPLHQWPSLAVGAFVLGGGWTLWSLGSLGRSFAIFPGTRALITRGPYRLVRHPAYLGETFMVGACGIAGFGAYGVLWALMTALTLVPRVLAEERLLEALPAHESFRQDVPWRLIPGIW